MRISAKGRYALAAIIEIARQTADNELVSVINIAGSLGISKIYLEQVLSQLKKEEIIFALKGSKGGYKLARSPADITVLEILAAVETLLLERAEATVEEQAPDIETALREIVFIPLDSVIKDCLESITLQDLLDYANRQRSDLAFMLNI